MGRKRLLNTRLRIRLSSGFLIMISEYRKNSNVESPTFASGKGYPVTGLRFLILSLTKLNESFKHSKQSEEKLLQEIRELLRLLSDYEYRKGG